MPGPVEEFGCDLRIHDVVDHGVYVCSAVELSCELWRDPVRHICAGVCLAVDERWLGRSGVELRMKKKKKKKNRKKGKRG